MSEMYGEITHYIPVQLYPGFRYWNTDFRSRWKEIEIDRQSAGIDLDEWSPFSKALQNANLKALVF